MSNRDDVKRFGLKLLDIYTGSILTQMIDVGYRTSLFEASSQGAATSEELSEKTGLYERYVREWLGAMTTSGIYQYNADTRRYSLPAEHAVLLTGGTARNVSPMSRLINQLGNLVPTLVERFRDGDGIPYSAYQPEFTHSMDDFWHRIYDDHLVDGFLGRFADLTKAMTNGIRVLDVGCGTGHAINVLARQYPKSTFVGYDLDEDAIQQAQMEARKMGLSNAIFEVLDVTRLPTEPSYQLIMAFDTVHHLPTPEIALSRIRNALTLEGAFLMVEFKFSSTVDGNIGNSFAPLYYGVSLLHCVPVSLASGGPGLGAVWGEQIAKQLLTEAGFNNITIADTPRPQNYMFLCRP